MSIAGVEYDHGFGVSAPSRFDLHLGRAGHHAADLLRRRRRPRTPAPARIVLGDGAELASVEVASGEAAAKPRTSTSLGIRILSLATEPLASTPAHIDWARRRPAHNPIPASSLTGGTERNPMHRKWMLPVALVAVSPGCSPVLYRWWRILQRRAAVTITYRGLGRNARPRDAGHRGRVHGGEPRHHGRAAGAALAAVLVPPLQTGAQGGYSARRVLDARAAIRPYAAGGQLLDISDAIESENVDLANYPQAVLDLVRPGRRARSRPPEGLLDTNGVSNTP